MENEIEVPAYAQVPPRANEFRTLVFENEHEEHVRKEFAGHGLKVMNAWSDDCVGRVKLDERGDLMFKVRPGFNVFVTIMAA